jgi:hypothetical protein
MPPTVNRSAVVVAPKQPFLDWLHRIDPTSRDLTLADLGEPNVYLLPECEDDRIMVAHVKNYCETIFEGELEGWWQDPGDWPSDRNYKTFCLWFDYRPQTLLFDLCDGPLSRD